MAFRGWVSTFCPNGGEQSLKVDKQWLQALLERNPLRLATEHHVPILANQWGESKPRSKANTRLPTPTQTSGVSPYSDGPSRRQASSDR